MNSIALQKPGKAYSGEWDIQTIDAINKPRYLLIQNQLLNELFTYLFGMNGKCAFQRIRSYNKIRSYNIAISKPGIQSLTYWLENCFYKIILSIFLTNYSYYMDRYHAGYDKIDVKTVEYKFFFVTISFLCLGINSTESTIRARNFYHLIMRLLKKFFLRFLLHLI